MEHKAPDTDEREFAFHDKNNATTDLGKGDVTLREEANEATAEEHSETLLGSISRHRRAVFWAGVVSLCIIMHGYDSALMGSLFGFPAFQKYYGHSSALGFASPIGNLVGVTVNGICTDHFGHKPVLIWSMVVLMGLVFIQFFATSVQVLFVGQLLCGIPWGIFSTLAPGYASEVAPLALRSYFETWVVCCWGIGQFVSYAVLFSLQHRDDHWAFRIPFAVQWVWPVLILPIVVFCPESPWWYVRQNHLEDARKSIQRLMNNNTSDLAVASEKALALMITTDRLEQEANAGTSYWDCFRKTDIWRTKSK
ncbi:hypothetical protein PRZ48_012768 [Zasmidium cellare]|uniref:Major facilitator superfamily (MFS) profile domain-containing protein n=1 Tax=Zasmidium cellare TaxID=395010 RepID=A0ABR0E606_ZASCE|nr:hypothetical protein PRZ48_012768 [Zasmidium cellare]